MADNTTPSRAANMEKAEGDRDTAASRYRDENGDNAGGISNRPFEEEAGNQQALPERGRGQSAERNQATEKRSRDRSVEAEWPSPRSDR